MTRLVDLDTKTICEDTLIKKLLDTYSTIRGWRNLWALSVCVDVAFVKVSLTSHGPRGVLRANLSLKVWLYGLEGRCRMHRRSITSEKRQGVRI